MDTLDAAIFAKHCAPICLFFIYLVNNQETDNTASIRYDLLHFFRQTVFCHIWFLISTIISQKLVTVSDWDCKGWETNTFLDTFKSIAPGRTMKKTSRCFQFPWWEKNSRSARAVPNTLVNSKRLHVLVRIFSLYILRHCKWTILCV